MKRYTAEDMLNYGAFLHFRADELKGKKSIERLQAFEKWKQQDAAVVASLN